MTREQLLDEKVLYQKGRWQRVRRWWKGVHPERGTIIQGLTGWETVEETNRIVPILIFAVEEN